MMEALERFLVEIDERQSAAYQKIPLFNLDVPKNWSENQRKTFVKVFYHTRGHFDRLLWTRLMGSNTQEEKKRILQYMSEEAGLEDGKNYPSHEKLFAKFASALGVELTPEVTEREGFLPFVRDFNFNLISYFKSADKVLEEIYFTAYERLDNLDYEFMYETALALGVDGEAVEFFEVHKNADHFEKTSENLEKYWKENPEQVKEGFKLVYQNQLTMWQGLNDAVPTS